MTGRKYANYALNSCMCLLTSLYGTLLLSKTIFIVWYTALRNGDLRLARFSSTSSTYSSGRLEIFINGQWGTVCDDFFSSTDAGVACRQMGFSGGSTTSTSWVTVWAGNELIKFGAYIAPVSCEWPISIWGVRNYLHEFMSLRKPIHPIDLARLVLPMLTLQLFHSATPIHIPEILYTCIIASVHLTNTYSVCHGTWQILPCVSRISTASNKCWGDTVRVWGCSFIILYCLLLSD